MTTPTSGVTGSTTNVLGAFGSPATSISPDLLLEYCQTQLGTLDSAMNQEMETQKFALGKRTAIQVVQGKLEPFGTDGPTNVAQLQDCETTYNDAMSGLPLEDPTRIKLEADLHTLETWSTNLDNNPDNTDDIKAGWKAMTDGLANLGDDVKSDAEIQMLHLQDLVSQRQQVVEQITGMMSKEDQMLESGAKAIGE